MTLSTEQQLQALLDKQAIHDLIHAYCNAADRRDLDKMRALYHEDAIDDHGGHRPAGPELRGHPMPHLDRGAQPLRAVVDVDAQPALAKRP